MSYKLRASYRSLCSDGWWVHLIPKQTEADILKVFSSSLIKGSLPRAICVEAIAMASYLVMTVLLSFLILMHNALGACSVFDTYFCDKSRALMFHSHTVFNFTIYRKDKITTNCPNCASESCQSQTWPCLSDRPWVVCMCQRYGVTAGDTLHFSQWNLSSTWDSRLESDNHHWLVTSMFSLNVQSFKGRGTQPPKESRILKIIYWWHLLNCVPHVTLNFKRADDF